MPDAAPIRRLIARVDAWLLGPHARAAPDEARAARTLAWTSTSIGLTAVAWTPLCLVIYPYVGLGAACAAAGAAFLGAAVALRSGASLHSVRIAVLATSAALFVVTGPLSSGVAALMSPWLTVMVMLATYLLDTAWAARTAVALSVALVGMYALESRGVVVPLGGSHLAYARDLLVPSLTSMWIATGLVTIHQFAIHRAQAARERAEAELRRAHRLDALGRLVAGLAHEINNPLTFILGNVEAVREELPTGSVHQRMLDDALLGVDRVRRLVADLRLLSQDGAEPATWVDLADVVAFSIKLSDHVVRRSATVRVEVPEGLQVHVPQTRLGQVLVNLLVNAAQAIGPGDPGAHTIVIRATSGDPLFVEVVDDGPGLDDATLAQAFDPFFTTKRVGEGTGLGLSISLGIAHGFGGDLTLRSTRGRGATAAVRLPAWRRGAGT